METELVISDLEIVEEQLKKIERVAKVSKEKHGEEQEVLLKIQAYLEKGEFVESSEFSEEQKVFLRSFNLITTKPLFYVANVDETGLNDPLDERLEALTEQKVVRQWPFAANWRKNWQPLRMTNGPRTWNCTR